MSLSALSRDCPACSTTHRLAVVVGGVHRCDCGAEYLADRPERLVRASRWAPTGDRRSRPLPRPPEAPERAVRAYVADVLRWDTQVAVVERAQRGGQSTLAPILRVAELGILGTGCRGTKGVGRSSGGDSEARSVDPIASARYRTLRGIALRVTEAVIADGQGDQLVEVRVGERGVVCDLAQRVAFLVADMETARRWHAKIAIGDSSPALRGARVAGEDWLLDGARAWWGDIS